MKLLDHYRAVVDNMSPAALLVSFLVLVCALVIVSGQLAADIKIMVTKERISRENYQRDWN